MSVALLKTRYVSKSVSRGRPKSKVLAGPTQEIIKKKIDLGLQNVNTPVGVLSSMYSLKKLSEEEYVAAKFYEKMSYSISGIVDCSARRKSSILVELSNSSSGSVKHFSKNNQKTWKKWIRIRSMLVAQSKKMDQVIYDTLVKNKPVNHMNMRIFKEGLGVLYDYCSKSKMSQDNI